MKRTAKWIAVGSAFALFASTALTGVASAAPGTGSLGSSSLGSLSPEFTSPHELADEPGCSENYFTTTKKWEINWGQQTTLTDPAKLRTSESFGGLTYIDAQYPNKTPADELAIVKASEKPVYQWYPSRDMVSNGAELTLGFEDGTVMLGEVMVGSDSCPSVRWTEYPAEGEAVTDTPDTFPTEAPDPTKPEIPSDSSTGSLGSLFGS